jgi:lia operon protein LiaG
MINKISNFIKETVTSEKFVGELETYDMHEEMIAKDIEKIKVTVRSAEVVLVPVEGEKIVVEYSKTGNEKGLKRKSCHIQVIDGSLSVYETKDEMTSGVVYVKEEKLTILLPHKLYHSIAVSTSSGSIVATEILAKELLLEASSGSVKASDLNVEGKATIKTSSGKANVQNTKCDELNVQASSGKIIVGAVKSTTAFIKASSGKISAEHMHTSATSLRSSSGEIIGSNIGGEIETKTSSGKVELAFEEIQHDINVQTSSGSVYFNVEEPKSLSVVFNSSSGSFLTNCNVQYENTTKNKTVGKIGLGENNLTVKTTSGSFNLFQS